MPVFRIIDNATPNMTAPRSIDDGQSVADHDLSYIVCCKYIGDNVNAPSVSCEIVVLNTKAEDQTSTKY